MNMMVEDAGGILVGSHLDAPPPVPVEDLRLAGEVVFATRARTKYLALHVSAGHYEVTKIVGDQAETLETYCANAGMDRIVGPVAVDRAKYHRLNHNRRLAEEKLLRSR